MIKSQTPRYSFKPKTNYLIKRNGLNLQDLYHLAKPYLSIIAFERFKKKAQEVRLDRLNKAKVKRLGQIYQYLFTKHDLKNYNNCKLFMQLFAIKYSSKFVNRHLETIESVFLHEQEVFNKKQSLSEEMEYYPAYYYQSIFNAKNETD